MQYLQEEELLQKDMFQTQEVQANLGTAAEKATHGQGIIRIAGMEEVSIVDGPGVRTVIFTQGCPHFCEGCHNPSTHSENGGSEADIRSIINSIWRNRHYLNGITLSGGEPFMQAEACAQIAMASKDMGLNVWCYTGFTYESLEILGMMDEAVRELLGQIDVLVDGPFEKRLRTLDLPFRGSSNQRLIDIPKSISEGRTVLYEEGAYGEEAEHGAGVFASASMGYCDRR